MSTRRNADAVADDSQSYRISSSTSPEDFSNAANMITSTPKSNPPCPSRSARSQSNQFYNMESLRPNSRRNYGPNRNNNSRRIRNTNSRFSCSKVIFIPGTSSSPSPASPSLSKVDMRKRGRFNTEPKSKVNGQQESHNRQNSGRQQTDTRKPKEFGSRKFRKLYRVHNGPNPLFHPHNSKNRIYSNHQIMRNQKLLVKLLCASLKEENKLNEKMNQIQFNLKKGFRDIRNICKSVFKKHSRSLGLQNARLDEHDHKLKELQLIVRERGSIAKGNGAKNGNYQREIGRPTPIPMPIPMQTRGNVPSSTSGPSTAGVGTAAGLQNTNPKLLRRPMNKATGQENDLEIPVQEHQVDSSGLMHPNFPAVAVPIVRKSPKKGRGQRSADQSSKQNAPRKLQKACPHCNAKLLAMNMKRHILKNCSKNKNNKL